MALNEIAASITIRLKKKLIYMSSISLTKECWPLLEPKIRLSNSPVDEMFIKRNTVLEETIF